MPAYLPREISEDERRHKREAALRGNVGHFLWHGYHGPRRTRADRGLLGKLADAQVAARIGRTVAVVWQKRNLARLPSAKDGRRARRRP